MSKTVVDEETGKEEILYTAEEIEAAKQAEITRLGEEHKKALEDKDNHMKEKLDEFTKGKTSQELKDLETEKKITEAKEIAEKATGLVTAAETRRIGTLKDVARNQFTGGNPELDKQFEDAWVLVNLEIKEDSDVMKKAETAAKIAGLTQEVGGGFGGGMPPSGGYAPNFVKKDEKAAAVDHETFKGALGLDKFLEETAGPKALEQK